MNRMVSRNDNLLYQDALNLMEEEFQEGDLLLHEPTKPGKLKYTQISKEWPLLKDGATIWLDGRLELQDFHLSNQTLKSPWHIENVRIKRIPTGRFKMYRGPLSYGGYLFKIVGVKNLKIEWSGKDFQGFKNWPEHVVFVKDLFGAWFDSDGYYESDHIIYLDVEDGGSIEMEGYAAGGGSFATQRAVGVEVNKTVKVKFTNFYNYPTGRGEHLYIGSTSGPDVPKIIPTIHDGLLIGSAAETVQLQHTVGEGDVSNLTIIDGGINWPNGFQRYQDSCFQISADSGNIKIHHNIVDGWGSNGIVTYSSPGVKAGSVVEISDTLFKSGGGILHYINNSCRYGMTWKFKNITVCCFTNEYYEWTGLPLENFMFGKNNGTDLFLYENVTHDKSKERLFQEENTPATNISFLENIPHPVYNNSGFKPGERLKKFTSTYANYFPSLNGTAMHFDLGDIIVDDEQFYPRRYCKCLVKHDYDLIYPVRPKNSENFLPLMWDENGKRNDDPKFSYQTPHRLYPPHDYRTVGSHYKKLGFRSTSAYKVIRTYIEGDNVVFETENNKYIGEVIIKV